MHDTRRLLILTYHGIVEEPDVFRPGQQSALEFEVHMSVLSRLFNVLTVSQGARMLRAGKLPPRAVSVSFDDGYRNNLTVAVPILHKYDLKATFFIATGFLDGGLMWNDGLIESIRRSSVDALDLRDKDLNCWSLRSNAEKRNAIRELIDTLKYRDVDERQALVDEVGRRVKAKLPADLMLASREVLEMSQAGMEIGAHTVNHPILTNTEPDVAEQEIRASKSAVERITGTSVSAFAYPNGRPGIDFDDSHRRLVQHLGFECAVSTAPGVATRNDDIFALSRLAPWDTSAGMFALRMLAYSTGLRSR